jgi:hypothetical protein
MLQAQIRGLSQDVERLRSSVTRLVSKEDQDPPDMSNWLWMTTPWEAVVMTNTGAPLHYDVEKEDEFGMPSGVRYRAWDLHASSGSSIPISTGSRVMTMRWGERDIIFARKPSTGVGFGDYGNAMVTVVKTTNGSNPYDLEQVGQPGFPYAGGVSSPNEQPGIGRMGDKKVGILTIDANGNKIVVFPKGTVENVRIVDGKNPYTVEVRGWNSATQEYEDSGETRENVYNEFEPIGTGILAAIEQDFITWLSEDGFGNLSIKVPPPRKICWNGSPYRIRKEYLPTAPPDVYSLENTPPSKVWHYNSSVVLSRTDRTVVQFDLSDLLFENSSLEIRADYAMVTWKVLGKRGDSSGYGYSVFTCDLGDDVEASEEDYESIAAGTEIASFDEDHVVAPVIYTAMVPVSEVMRAAQAHEPFCIGFKGTIEDNLSGDEKIDEIVIGEFQLCLFIQADKRFKIWPETVGSVLKNTEESPPPPDSYELGTDWTAYNEWDGSTTHVDNKAWFRYVMPEGYAGKNRNVKLCLKIDQIYIENSFDFTAIRARRMNDHIGASGPSGTEDEYETFMESGNSVSITESLSSLKSGDWIVFDFENQDIHEDGTLEFSVELLNHLLFSDTNTISFEEAYVIVQASDNIGIGSPD